MASFMNRLKSRSTNDVHDSGDGPAIDDTTRVEAMNTAMVNNRDLYHTNFQTLPFRKNPNGESCCTKCNNKARNANPVKVALLLALIAILITVMATTITTTVMHEEMEAQHSRPQTYGVKNVNVTYEIGGYYGWEYHDNFPDMYPFQDIHATVGDRVKFWGRDGTVDDVYLVPESIYESCNFTNETWSHLMALRYQTSTPEGYLFLIQDWHSREFGDTLYFVSSATGWSWFDGIHEHRSQSCVDGVKARLIIEDIKAIPVITDKAAADFDVANTETVKDLTAAVGLLSRMLILSQFNFEQRVRSEGDSGITTVRGYHDGDAAYDDGTFSNGAAASIHNHADHIRVVGIGEISAVLNGVEFQTRHNDYNLNMPSRDEYTYGRTQPIYEYLFPEDDDAIPASVRNKNSVSKQIEEMQEYFRAFKTQNTSHRDYTPYFKPIMCYVEGTWLTDSGSLDEPFDSDRHEIDARTWKALHDKIRWMSNSGRKNSAENLAHLPSSIRNLYNETYPVTSNWEYRVLCAPLENDIPTSRFEIADDLHVQLGGSPKTREELYYDRRARFKLNTYINLGNLDDHRWSAGQRRWNYLDYLMEQIPGKDNYGANVNDTLPDGTEGVIHYVTDEPVNSGYYSRYYGLNGADAMGSTKHRRSWHDRYLFAAKTTQSKVSPIAFDYEMEDGSLYSTISRWSYAIPLEIIYLTPLSRWNPYNIEYKDSWPSGSGSCPNSPYSHWTDSAAFFTPSSFFDGVDAQEQADTSGSQTCVEDEDGNVRYVRASGHWITFPEIANGVGYVRQRYPIFPIHEAGSAAWKEAKALQDIVLPDDYDDIYTGVDFFGADRDLKYGFILYLQGGGHQHAMYIPGWKVSNYWYDSTNDLFYNGSSYVIEEDSDERAGHSHTVKIWRWREDDSNTDWNYVVEECRYGTLSDEGVEDNAWDDDVCDDGHGTILRT